VALGQNSLAAPGLEKSSFYTVTIHLTRKLSFQIFFSFTATAKKGMANNKLVREENL